MINMHRGSLALLVLLLLLFANTALPGPGGGTAFVDAPLRRNTETGALRREVQRTPELTLDVRMDEMRIPSGNNTTITVNVAEDGLPAANISLNMTVTAGNLSKSNATTSRNGSASVKYTAPVLERTQEVELTLIANRTRPDENGTEVLFLVLSREDQMLPYLKNMTPGSHADEVDIHTKISLEFSEAMNRSSVGQAVSVFPHFAHSMAWAGSVAVLRPDEPLSWNTTYRIYVSTVAEDLYGNPLDEAFKGVFKTTRAPVRRIYANISGFPAKMAEKGSVLIRFEFRNYTGAPLPGVNATFDTSPSLSVEPPAIHADSNGRFDVTLYSGLVSENTTAYLNLTCEKKNYDPYYLNRTILIRNDVSLPVLSVSVAHPPVIYAGERHEIFVEVKGNSGPVGGANVTLEASAGTLTNGSGSTNSSGRFSAVFSAPEMNGTLKVNITLTVAKEGFEKFITFSTLTIEVPADRLVDDTVRLSKGAVVDLVAMVRGSVMFEIGEIDNPSWYTKGFMEVFFEIKGGGPGYFEWINITVTNLTIPPDHDGGSIYMSRYRRPYGPWLRCDASGFLKSDVSVWVNVTSSETTLPLLLAPRALNVSAILRGTLGGSVTDVGGRPVKNISVALYKSDVRIDAVVTDGNGSFLFENLESGTYEIRVESGSYEPFAKRDILIRAGSTNEMGKITLQRAESRKEDGGDGGFPSTYSILLVIFVIIIVLVGGKLIAVRAKGRKVRPGGYSGKYEREQEFSRIVSELGERMRATNTMGEFECPICGSGVNRDATRCLTCSAEFVSNKFVCPDCGMPISSSDDYCEMCGTVFGDVGSREWKEAGQGGNVVSGEWVPIDDFEVVDDEDMSIFDILVRKQDGE